MKILIVSHEYPPVGGGGANACMNLALEYAKKGNDVHVVTVWYQGEKEYDEIKNNGTVFLYKLKTKRKFKEHCSFFEMLDFLKKAIDYTNKLEKKERFDICQIFFGIPSGPVGYFLKKKYGLPYVIRFGGGDIPGFQDRFSFIYKLISPFIRKIWKKSDALVANSRGLKNLAANFYNKKEILVIPNGSDIRAFSNGLEETNEKENIIQLLFVSRLIARKGLQDVIPQIKVVDEACKREGLKIHFDIVGDGPYREDLELSVKKENIENIVTFYGQKDKSELPYYYDRADIFIFPSRKEGMPNAVLEAMSYGLPIIMTHCQGSDELIDGNGFITEVSDFNNKILELCLNKEMREKMGVESENRIRNIFSWDKTSDRYLELFEMVVHQ